MLLLGIIEKEEKEESRLPKKIWGKEKSKEKVMDTENDWSYSFADFF